MPNIINIEAMRESAIHTASIQTLQSQIAKLLTEEESSERAVKLAALYAKQAIAMRQHNAALKREEKETAVPVGRLAAGLRLGLPGSMEPTRKQSRRLRRHRHITGYEINNSI